MNFKEEDIVFCRVVKVEGTTVFVEVEEKYPGTIVFSEVAAGRIRNIREHVVPDKRIVCKVLRVTKDHLELSLRRVTAKEREEVVHANKQQKALESILKAVGEKPEKVIAAIRTDWSMHDFLAEAKESSKVFEKYVEKEKAKKIFEMFAEKSEKQKTVRKDIVLKSVSDRGVKDIKEILDVKEDVHYLGSANFSITVLGKDFKEANAKMAEVLKIIEERAKQKKAFFEIKK